MKTVFLKYSVLICLLGLFISTKGGAQEDNAKNYRMYFKFSTVKQPDNSRILEVSYVGRNKKDRKISLPVYDAEIKFFNILNDEEVLLGSSKTSKSGTAQLILPENQKYLIDGQGNIILKARFDGTDSLDEEEEEITVKNVFLELNLAEIDSVKTITVTGFTKDSIGTQTPLEDVDINIYIDGMLAKMKINEGTLSDGELELPFDTMVPGDVDGNVTIFAMIEDNDAFGKVVQKNSIQWGISDKKADTSEHKLWSKAGPMWMYIVLSILLIGVWANYIYTIINLYKISKSKIQIHENN